MGQRHHPSVSLRRVRRRRSPDRKRPSNNKQGGGGGGWQCTFRPRGPAPRHSHQRHLVGGSTPCFKGPGGSQRARRRAVFLGRWAPQEAGGVSLGQKQ
jgi:hypothetical protein